MALFCKYCGKELKAGVSGVTASSSSHCSGSPTGKHIALSNPPHCVYCGGETKPGRVLTVNSSTNCNASPNKQHQLDE
jgi:hypothetical protein